MLVLFGFGRGLCWGGLGVGLLWLWWLVDVCCVGGLDVVWCVGLGCVRCLAGVFFT